MKAITNSIIILFIFLAGLEAIAQTKELSLKPPKGKAVAVFAEGCFWCSEHIFEAVEGVDEAISGYSGGKLSNPTYQQVGSETTGHAEVILVYYDPKKISFSELVKVFFASHDPTTPNQQGPDRGSSYRSIAFYQNDEEKAIIEKEIVAVNQSKRFKNKVVTEVLPVQKFYKAEDYHQDYIEHHPENPYVQNVSLPRFELFKKTYKGKLKKVLYTSKK
jgi:peptide-methionine (S)-S-oxide reductase